MRIVYDCDNTMGLPRKEVDDGLSLLYLLGRDDVELLGVTTTWGNGPVDAVTEQTRLLLRKAGRADIPVVQGSGGRGDGPTEAARLLVRLAAEQPGELTVLATGPLGNLRAAATLDPDFLGNLRQIACMGGVTHPLRIGRRDLAELNFSCDPEGARVVLDAPCPVTLMDAHVCLEAPFRWGDVHRLATWSRSTRRILREWLIAFSAYTGVGLGRASGDGRFGEIYLWDLLPAVWLSHPELFDQRRVRVASTVVELETGLLRYEAGDAILAPEHVLDRDALMDTLFAAWQRVPLRW